MIGLLAAFGEDALWLVVCMAMTGVVIGVLAGGWELACRSARFRVAAELRELDEGLPAHTPGPVRTSRRARRRLHRDLVLLLVVNADQEQDEDA